MPASSGDYEMLTFQYKITHLKWELALALCQGQKAHRDALSCSPLDYQAQLHLFPPTGWFPFPLLRHLPQFVAPAKHLTSFFSMFWHRCSVLFNSVKLPTSSGVYRTSTLRERLLPFNYHVCCKWDLQSAERHHFRGCQLHRQKFVSIYSLWAFCLLSRDFTLHIK